MWYTYIIDIIDVLCPYRPTGILYTAVLLYDSILNQYSYALIYALDDT